MEIIGDKKKCVNIELGEKMHFLEKNNENFSFENQMKNLYHLQLIISEVNKIKLFFEDIPLEVKDLKDRIAEIFISINNFQKSLSEYSDQINQEKIKIANANILMEKYKNQITNVRNTKEYGSLSKEIENQELDIQLSEKYIHNFMEKIHLLETKMQNSQQLLKDKQLNLQEKEEELEKIFFEKGLRKKQLEKKIQQIEKLIKPYLLISFDKLRNNTKNGLAVVCIKRDACGGCFNKIPPQKQVEVKMRKRIIFCEHCGRIIVDSMLNEKGR